MLYYLWIFSTDIIHPLEIYLSYHNSWISLSHSWMVWRIQSSSTMLYGKITENPSVISTMPCCTRKIKTSHPVFHPVFSPWCIMVVHDSLAVTVGSVRSNHWGVRPLLKTMSRWWMVVVSNMFYVHPDPRGNDPIWLYNIFQMGWNQLDEVTCLFFVGVHIKRYYLCLKSLV